MTLPNENEPTQHLTPRQVATLLQVRELTVRRWLRRNLLVGVKLGHVWRVSREELQRFVSTKE